MNGTSGPSYHKVLTLQTQLKAETDDQLQLLINLMPSSELYHIYIAILVLYYCKKYKLSETFSYNVVSCCLNVNTTNPASIMLELCHLQSVMPYILLASQRAHSIKNVSNTTSTSRSFTQSQHILHELVISPIHRIKVLYISEFIKWGKNDWASICVHRLLSLRFQINRLPLQRGVACQMTFIVTRCVYDCLYIYKQAHLLKV